MINFIPSKFKDDMDFWMRICWKNYHSLRKKGDRYNAKFWISDALEIQKQLKEAKNPQI